MSEDLGAALPSDNVGTAAGFKIVGDENDDYHQCFPYSLPPETFSAGIATLVRDLYWLEEGEPCHKPQHVVRLICCVTVFLFKIAVQLWLIVAVQVYILTPALRTARHHYTEYEKIMYAGNVYDPYHWWWGSTERRGEYGFFNKSLFKDVPDETKDIVCFMPLSEPPLLFPVLLVWAATVCADIRKLWEIVYTILFVTPNADSMSQALDLEYKDAPEVCGEDHEAVIVMLTLPVKIVLSVLFFIPRFVVDVILLLAGTRLLIATSNFTEVLINTVALEFILQMQSILYLCIPERLQRETEGTMVLPRRSVCKPGLWVYLDIYLFLVFACIFVLIAYMFQNVLYRYQQDLAEVCQAHSKVGWSYER